MIGAPAGIQRLELALHLIAKLASDFLWDETGATSIEYGIIAGGIAVALAAVVAQVGGQLNTSFEAVKPILVPK